MKVLVELIPAAFFTNRDLRAWIHMKAVSLALRHGVCEVSSYSFAGYGTVLTATFDRLAEGESFGRMALALNERFGDRKLAARLCFHYGGWHASWVRPFDDGKQMLRRGHELARQVGDTSYETYTATVLSVVSFCESASLKEVGATAEWAHDVAARRKDRDMASVPEAHARYAAALRGETPSPRDLGLAGSSDAELRARLDAKTPTAMFYYLFCNAELAYLFDDPARAHALLQEAERGSHVINSLPTMVELCFLQVLVAARLHDSAPLLQRAALRRRVAARIRRLRLWAKSCPENFEAHCLIALAEAARMGGRRRVAQAKFERAASAAREHRSAKREAIALELASRCANGRGDAALAARLRGEAARAYRRWGAAAKADGLQG
jgi:hypothetical protein